MQSPKSTVQFYRRRLPSTCVDFSSEEGKNLFIGALGEGHANIYFKLAAQYLTQEEPSFCGLSTLVMVLNALEVDPARVWKGAWRWYHETMLDCCIPLETVIQVGITVDQFQCLATCNRLNVTRFNVPPITTDPGDKWTLINEFRKHVLQSVRSNDTILVVSYCRKTLGQTGLGHFSPLAAYNKESDKALIMDVARFKYPPHWVSIELLWEAMREIDPDTGKPRAYFLLSLNENLRPMLFLRLVDPSMLRKVVGEMELLFRECNTDQQPLDSNRLALMVTERIANILMKYNILDIRQEPIVEQNGCCVQDYLTTEDHESSSKNVQSSEKNSSPSEKNVQSTEKTSSPSEKNLSSSEKTCCSSQRCSSTKHEHVQRLVEELVQSLENTLEYQHLMETGTWDKRRCVLAVSLFLSWPFEIGTSCQVCSALSDHCRSIINKLPASARNEVTTLNTQILALLGKGSNSYGKL